MTWRDRWEALRRDPRHRAYVLAEEAKHTLAARVHALRRERGLSQSALARLAGTKQPNISDIETADANVTIETLGKLAAALGVTVAELLAAPAGSPPAGRSAHAESGPMPLPAAVYVAEGFLGFAHTQPLKWAGEGGADVLEADFVGDPDRTWS